MTLTQKQKKDLDTPPPADAIKTREEGGQSLAYLEGWYVIREANRIFGHEHWDRITLTAQCVWQGKQDGRAACTYTARVRICVRSKNETFVREGSGAGHATGMHPGEAHAQALKAAETDATKRALATLGAPFGLTLYETPAAPVPEKATAASVEGEAVCRNGVRAEAPRPWLLRSATGEAMAAFTSPILFCSSLRRAIENCHDAEELEAIYQHNHRFLARLVAEKPQLRDKTERHYAEILSALFQTRLESLSKARMHEKGEAPPANGSYVTAPHPPLS
ncbi:MAG: Rad52/Rad22 family DNA repair protein [Parvibaculum sp.]